MMKLGLSPLVVLVALAAPTRADEPTAEQREFFEKKVRPLLVESCHKCHGEGKLKASLSLASRATLLKGGDTGPAVVPGEPEKSLLIKAVRYTDPDLRMPPKGKLSDEQIADLAAWVKMGAPWPDSGAVVKNRPGDFDLAERKKFWSLQPVQRPALPPVKDAAWPLTPVDHFLLAKLEAAGLKPNPPAEPRVLVRRLYFDLIGLPPTPEEVEAFVRDAALNRQKATEKLVDHLLASPHYGEAWARRWLDLVRYAETAGHEFDFELSHAWRYRDYVIRAFNADVPFDRFVMEHIAGDLLPEPRLHPVEKFDESVLGTGFWFLGESKHSPVDVKGDLADRMDNQIDVFGKTFLGTTIACARCHDHKFDAVTTKDYYALTGFLQSARPRLAFLDDRAKTAKALARAREARAEIEKLLAPTLPKTPQERADDKSAVVFENFSGADHQGWIVNGPAFLDGPSKGGQPRLVGPAARPLVEQARPGAHSGLLADGLAGELRSPTFEIKHKSIHVLASGAKARVHLIVEGLQHLRDPIYGGLTRGVNAPTPQWTTFNVSMWQGRRAYLELVDEGPGHLAVETIVFADGPPPPAPASLRPVAPSLSPENQTRLAELSAILAQTEREMGAVPRTMALQEGSPVTERVFVRGSHKNLGEEAPPRLLEALVGPGSRTSRLELAKQVASPSNPLTARVLVNRLWKHHFGEGLVRSVDDFGALGQRPTHPELLDWLAAELVSPKAGDWRPETGDRRPETGDRRPETGDRRPETGDWRPEAGGWRPEAGGRRLETGDRRPEAEKAPLATASGLQPPASGLQSPASGLQPPASGLQSPASSLQPPASAWSLKKMHRLLVLSRAYQTSSTIQPAAQQIDGDNKLLHRYPVRRLDAEAIRDMLLALSGRLDRTMYGPGPLPHLTEHMGGRGRPGASGPLDGGGRRSLYINVRRNFLTPLFLVFDYPVPFSTVGRRTTSNVPAQALAMMNNPFVLQQAQLWAKRALEDKGLTAEARLDRMFLAALARAPLPDERQELLAFLREREQSLGRADDPRAWADLAHVIVNLKELIYLQ